MPTMVYSPGVKVYIDTGPARLGLIDVSDDLLDGSMIRRTDGVSTFNFTLQNTRRKYDSLFTPNDRLIVLFKRVVWVKVFSGYLNSVPLVSAWPMPVMLAASCTLKRLQYWYWDAYTQASLALIGNTMAISNNDPKTTDGGIAQVVNVLLQRVAFWPKESIHIGRIPADWYALATQIAQSVETLAVSAEQAAARMLATTGGAGTVAGVPVGDTTGSYVNGSLQDGTYGGVGINGDQCRMAEIIYSTGRQTAGVTDTDIAVALVTAYTESTLISYQQRIAKHIPVGDFTSSGAASGSVGLFQQKEAGWGPLSVRADPAGSAGLFYKALLRLPLRSHNPIWVQAQAVQHSAYSDGSNYQQYAGLGPAVVAAINGTAASKAKSSNNLPVISPPSGATGTTSGATTGDALASVGLTLANTFQVPYVYGASASMSALVKNPPASVDCSSFIQWCYLHTRGVLSGLPRVAADQYNYCKSAGMDITVSQAFSTAGALVFVGSTPGGIHHVEMCLGDGRSTVAAQVPGTVVKVTDYGTATGAQGYFNYGALLPFIDYGATRSGQVHAPGANVNQSPGSSTVPYYQKYQSTSTDAIDSIFGQGTGQWVALQGDQSQLNLAAALTGVLTLLNDQPLLPYIINLMNSTMRSFCSAPNGDFIAWFPDYYGLWGTAAKMVVEPIEVQDFAVYWSDDVLVTHQFTMAGTANNFNISTGAISTQYGVNPGVDPLTLVVQTKGIASIDIPGMLTTLFGIPPADTNAFAKFVYSQFGARPSYSQMEGLIGDKGAFFGAMFLFLRQWGYQYNATVPLTFMPEIYPGMLLQIPKFNFQAYVSAVTHSFNFTGGGFTTTVNVSAPARMPSTNKKDKSHLMLGMPTAGDYIPGLQTGLTVTPGEINVVAQSQAAKIKSLIQKGL